MLLKLVLILLSLVAICFSQLIIPRRPLGYIYAGGSNDAAIHLDVHMCLLCYDSMTAHPVAIQVADHYGAATLKLTMHMFPLPYHHQAFLTAKGAEVVRKLGAGDATAYRWFQYIYENLHTFSNSATANMTANDVILMLSTAAQTIGIDPAQFQENMKSGDIETVTRAAWKYSCTRGIASTPTYLLNDITVSAEPTWTLHDWRKVIDPLLQSGRKMSNKGGPTDKKKAENGPGKMECCKTKGVARSLNGRCRCSNKQKMAKWARYALGRFLPVRKNW